MTFACQSLSTLEELLREASAFVACLPRATADGFTTRIQDLERSVRGAEGRASAQVEQEIVSLWERARIECARCAAGQISPAVAGGR